jgi:hypothetical protein
MTEAGDLSTSELAGRLRYWIVVGGYIPGGWMIFQGLLALLVRGMPPMRFFYRSPLTLAHVQLLFGALIYVSPLVLGIPAPPPLGQACALDIRRPVDHRDLGRLCHAIRRAAYVPLQ